MGEAAKRYYHRHKEKCLNRHKEWAQQNKEHLSSYRVSKRQTLRGRLSFLRSNSIQRNKNKFGIQGVDFSLDDLVDLYNRQNGFCAMTNETMTFDSGGPFSYTNSISIDRIDSSKCYSKDNIQLVTNKINLIKRDLSQSDFISLCEKVWRSSCGTVC